MPVTQTDSIGSGRLSEESLSRYDLVLVVLPLLFVLATAAGALSTIPMRVALASASLFGGVLVADALFVNPPVRR